MLLFIRLRVIIYLICASFFLSAQAENEQSTLPTIQNIYTKAHLPIRTVRYGNGSGNVLLICIPKCGTHLLTKCISLFKEDGLSLNYKKEIKPPPARLAQIRKLNRHMPPNHYKGEFYPGYLGASPYNLISRLTMKTSNRRLLWAHNVHNTRFENALTKINTTNFLMIRDPRAMVVSFAFMVHKSFEGKTANIQNIITDLITGRKQHYIRWGVEIQQAYPLLWEVGLAKFYELYLPWIKAKNFMLIRFEDLVGEKGGGSDAKQLEAMINIGKHINIAMNEQQIKNVINNLYGGTWTFREGQIDSWKKYFTPEIKSLFKNQPGLNQLLIKLGYEKDTNW